MADSCHVSYTGDILGGGESARALQQIAPHRYPAPPLPARWERGSVGVTGRALTGLMRIRTSQPISELAQSIVQRRIASVEVGSERWSPFFQFDPRDMSSVHLALARIECNCLGCNQPQGWRELTVQPPTESLT